MVIAYEASATILDVLAKVPHHIGGVAPSVVVSDDASTDDTFELAEAWASGVELDVDVLRQPANLGYGGNQKAAYRHAIERGADIVVLVHGDGQYPAEMAVDLAEPLVAGEALAVYGSRLLRPGGARAGNMPWIRLIANRTLSTYLNLASRSSMSEWFSGFRAYRTAALAAVDYESLPNGFDFDSRITLELLGRGERIVELPIPTHYGDEISRVPLIRTGTMALVHGARHALRRTSRGVDAEAPRSP